MFGKYADYLSRIVQKTGYDNKRNQKRMIWGLVGVGFSLIISLTGIISQHLFREPNFYLFVAILTSYWFFFAVGFNFLFLFPLFRNSVIGIYYVILFYTAGMAISWEFNFSSPFDMILISSGEFLLALISRDFINYQIINKLVRTGKLILPDKNNEP